MRSPSRFLKSLVAAAVSLVLVVSIIPPVQSAPAISAIEKSANPPLYNALHAAPYNLDPTNSGHINNEELESLTELDLSGIPDLESINGVQFCSNIKVLNLMNDTGLTYLPANMAPMAKLEVIAFDGITSLKSVENLQAITTAPNLRSVQIRNTDITDVSFLSAAPNLKTLLWSDNPGLTAQNIATLASLPQLKYLDLIGIPNIGKDGGAALSALAAMNNLEIIDISNCNIYDLSPLSGVTHFDVIIVRNNYLDVTPGSDDMKVIGSLTAAACEVWSEDQNQITINYVSSLGVPSKKTDTVYYQQSVTLPTSSVLPGYELMGWDINGDGKEDHAAGSTMAFTWPTLPVPGNKATFTAIYKDVYTGSLLRGIALSPTSLKLSPAFSGSRLHYTVSLPVSVGSVTITPAKPALATMTIDGEAVASKAISVYYGQSKTVAIAVTGKDGSKKTYRVTVTRTKPDASRLLYLGNSAGSLSPAFDPFKTAYTLTLAEGVGSVMLKPVKSVASSKLYINGALKPSMKFTLSPGKSTKATIKVVPSSGASRTYTVTIKRKPSTNATLKSISVVYALSPAFKASVVDYRVTVPENRAKATVKAVKADANAVVTINGVKTASKSFTLKNGQSITVTIVVKAQAGNKKTYTVKLTRPPHINYFTASPVVSGHPTVQPGVKPITFSYSLAGIGGSTKIQIKVGGVWKTLLERSDGAGAKSFVWNGKYGGVPVAKGKYQVRLVCSCGSISSSAKTSTIVVK